LRTEFENQGVPDQHADRAANEELIPPDSAAIEGYELAHGTLVGLFGR
jgi:hypothetical protein